MIRGKNVNEALAVLQFTNKRAADGIEKCVRSAISNATEAAEKANIAVDPDELWVKACFVDQGPSKGRRRMRPAPQGRAYRERRHFCHITVLLSSEGREAVGGGRRGRGGIPNAKARTGANSADGKSAKRGGTVAGAGRPAPNKASAPANETNETKSVPASAESATPETAQE